ncbi:peptide methionine sulfoxide reductase MsrA [Nitrospira sp.]|nr:peptide methionine sulfoxide reductase MsrA [Nitrospira sp.]
MTAQHDLVTLGGGCFWCLEAVYHQVKGVHSVASGYMGGQTAQPTYEAVCSGRTGHAEVVQVVFDPAIVSFRDILNIFFVIHDPTTLNRQGNDVGTQYRSVIFYHSPEQKTEAEAVMAELAKEEVFPKPVVTELVPSGQFYEAEAYHQEYFANNPAQPYCSFVVAPKVAKFRKAFASKLKPGL